MFKHPTYSDYRRWGHTKTAAFILSKPAAQWLLIAAGIGGFCAALLAIWTHSIA